MLLQFCAAYGASEEKITIFVLNLNRIEGYSLALLALALATLGRWLLDPWLGSEASFLTYFAAVALVGLYASIAAGVATTIVGGLLADVLFMSPRGAIGDWVGLLLFYGCAVFIIVLTKQLRESRIKLKEHNRMLEQVSKQKDGFIAELAHELRNPLASIVNAVELVRLSPDTKNTIQPAFVIVRRQAQHLKFLIDDLLDSARINTGRITLQREFVDFVEVARHSSEDMHAQCEASGLTLAVSTPEEPLWVHGDRGRLLQIVSNLLDNACKFTNPGGSVEMVVHQEDDECVLTIRDSGVGIDSAHLHKVFGAFVRPDDQFDTGTEGLGLGLYLVKGLVEKHGGSVRAHSGGPTCGSQFVVRLPLVPSEEVESSRTAPAVQKLQARDVLIIDDDADACWALKMLMESAGHEVLMSTNGKDGLATAEKCSPDAVLVDLGMPGMDGFEVARRLRKRFGKGIRLIAVTGYSQQQYRERARRAGFDDFLVKPTSVEAISNAIGTKDSKST